MIMCNKCEMIMLTFKIIFKHYGRSGNTEYVVRIRSGIAAHRKSFIVPISVLNELSSG